MKRRFELAGVPSRFWEIDYADGRVELRWGTDGEPLQQHSRPMDADAATAFVAKGIAAQLGRGYVELTQQQPRPVPEPGRAVRKRFTYRRSSGELQILDLTLEAETLTRRTGAMTGGVEQHEPAEVQRFATVLHAKAAFDEALKDARYDGWTQAVVPRAIARDRNDELELACLATPDDADAWGVYMDWLLSVGDVRGELASLLRRRDPSATRLLQQQWLTLGGGVAREWLKIWFEHGFARRIALGTRVEAGGARLHGPPLHALARDVLGAPITATIDTVTLGLPTAGRSDWPEAVRTVAASPRAGRIRVLTLDDEESYISTMPYGDLGGALAAMPRLERLVLATHRTGVLDPSKLPGLRSFARRSRTLRGAELAAIVLAPWPILEDLELGVESVDPAVLHPIFAGGRLPALRHLALVGGDRGDAFVEALAASPLLAQLDSVELSRTQISGRGAGMLAQHASRFRHLASLDLSGHVLAEGERALVRAVLDNVVL